MHGSSTAQTMSIRATRRTSARLSSRRSRVFDPLDFLAEVSAHIPDAHEKTTLFYGWYSNPACAVHADRRTRGYRKQRGLLRDAPPAQPAPDDGTRAFLEVRRSCLRRGVRLRLTRSPQARRARRSAELATKPDPPGLRGRSAALSPLRGHNEGDRRD